MHGTRKPPHDGDRKRKQARERKRRQRELEKRGMIVLPVEVHESKLAKALPSSGRLTPEKALKRSELAKAVGLLVADFIERWGVTRPL